MTDPEGIRNKLAVARVRGEAVAHETIDAAERLLERLKSMRPAPL